MPFRSSCLLASALALLGIVACSDDNASPDPARGPSGLAVSRIYVPGTNREVTRSKQTLTVDCKTPLLVEFEPAIKHGSLGDFRVAAPGACGSSSQCGSVVIVLDPPALADAGVVEPSAEREYPGLRSPIRVDLSPEQRTGTHEFRVELRDRAGRTVMQPDGTVLGKGLKVTLKLESPDCNRDTGSGGAGGAGGEGEEPLGGQAGAEASQTGGGSSQG